MSASRKNSLTNHTPGFLGGDLPEPEGTAYQEGHDADFLVKETTTGNTDKLSRIRSHEHTSQTEQQFPHRINTPGTETTDLEKQNRSEVSSISEVARASDIEKQNATTATTSEQPPDPNIIFWDSDTDPANPQNWSTTSKWCQVAVLSALTFLTPLASSMFAPGVPEVMSDFHTSSTLLATFVVSIYVLGFALGPLVIAPCSELYGRLPVYHICNIGFIGFTIACGRAQSMGELCAYRFLQGVWGVCPVTIGGGTIADLFIPEQRGAAMAIWAMGPLLGPVVGPVAGGFLSEATSWRWIFYVIAIATGLIAILAAIGIRETYAPILLERKASKLRKSTGNRNLRSKLDTGLNPRQLFLRAIVRPTKMLFLSPICFLMTLYMSIVYAFLYLLFTTFTFVFEDQYGFSASIVGLVYIGLGVGNFIGLGTLGFMSDRIAKRLTAKNGGQLKPEYRLPPLIWGGPFIPAGLFIYGWTAQYQVHWIVPLIGTTFIGIGLIAAFMCINTYLVDTFTLYAASAMAANTVLRSIFGGVFPLFGLQMYDTLGLGWGNSLLAFIGIALLPIPWLFYAYGERIRTHPKFQIKF
ncbi:Efflux pump radE [Pseudocercospora fuligena]|uniref:Cercosporin MFS transporter CTB4 n=1 Tax=Pseudocercospora fuligena TaxID=685502 RepID=A0A8H6R6U5_9PEZI|nr:Efflux pump radE [Pseudocercospora fuligena]